MKFLVEREELVVRTTTYEVDAADEDDAVEISYGERPTTESFKQIELNYINVEEMK